MFHPTCPRRTLLVAAAVLGGVLLATRAPAGPPNFMRGFQPATSKARAPAPRKSAAPRYGHRPTRSAIAPPVSKSTTRRTYPSGGSRFSPVRAKSQSKSTPSFVKSYHTARTGMTKGPGKLNTAVPGRKTVNAIGKLQPTKINPVVRSLPVAKGSTGKGPAKINRAVTGLRTVDPAALKALQEKRIAVGGKTNPLANKNGAAGRIGKINPAALKALQEKRIAVGGKTNPLANKNGAAGRIGKINPAALKALQEKGIAVGGKTNPLAGKNGPAGSVNPGAMQPKCALVQRDDGFWDLVGETHAERMAINDGGWYGEVVGGFWVETTVEGDRTITQAYDPGTGIPVGPPQIEYHDIQPYTPPPGPVGGIDIPGIIYGAAGLISGGGGGGGGGGGYAPAPSGSPSPSYAPAEPAPVPGNALPAKNIVLLNPEANAQPVAFLLAGQQQSLEAGQQVAFETSEPVETQFDRGGDFGTATHSLVEGVYEFKLTEEGWQLFAQEG